jgi:amidohydrolase
MSDFSARAEALREQLITWRRDFHMHPELAFEEVRTAGIVAEELRQLGLEVQTGVGKTGVVGILEGAHDGPTVLVRADMDALPVREDTGLPFASKTEGKMHACGHDGHVAVALATARMLAENRERMHGRIKFVFQPAEEIAHGATAMIADGVMENPRPDVSLGLHLWNSLPFGTIGMREGPMMAGASVFTIHIHGKGGHAASPHQTHDPVLCAAHLITQLQSVVSRNVPPLESAVVSVTMVHAGTADNVIPETVELRGTVRTFRREVRDQVVQRMNDLIELTCRAMQCSSSWSIEHVTEPVVNHPEPTAKMRAIFTKMAGVMQIDEGVATMGAEDMGYFMQNVPGVYFFVGAANPEVSTYYGHHHPRFTITEEALPLGAALLAAAAASYVLANDHG